jgi:CRISP-associated protein Cas1
VSRKPFDFLVSDKEPFIYVEKSIVKMDDGFLTLLNGKEGREIVAPASHLIMMLGAGTSITQEAAIFASLNDLQVAFSRGGCNVHSFFMSGRYQDPLFVMGQASLITSHKLAVAKKLMQYRLERNKYPADVVNAMLECNDLVSLVAWEGRWAKTVYKALSLKSKQSFTRNFDATDAINMKLNVVNNALYSFCTAICLSCGLHPSLGFIHGYSRRGGLAFDLADVVKQDTSLPIAFDAKTGSAKLAMYALSNKLRENNFEVTRTLVRLCLAIGSGDLAEVEKACASNRC